VQTTPASSERIAHFPASGKVSESREIVEKQHVVVVQRKRPVRGPSLTWGS
jgi:hypothetical protein